MDKAPGRQPLRRSGFPVCRGASDVRKIGGRVLADTRRGGHVDDPMKEGAEVAGPKSCAVSAQGFGLFRGNDRDGPEASKEARRKGPVKASLRCLEGVRVRERSLCEGYLIRREVGW